MTDEKPRDEDPMPPPPPPDEEGPKPFFKTSEDPDVILRRLQEREEGSKSKDEE